MFTNISVNLFCYRFSKCICIIFSDTSGKAFYVFIILFKIFLYIFYKNGDVPEDTPPKDLKNYYEITCKVHQSVPEVLQLHHRYLHP